MDTIIRPLPARVEALLTELNASPRLKAHLAVVHDTACLLSERIRTTWPTIHYDVDAVLQGAATHDIGKVLFPNELRQPGRLHETAGRQLLLQHGWPEPIARFAETHAMVPTQTTAVEDIVVALADNLWKGTREDALERALVNLISISSGERLWDIWLRLDDILTDIAANADDRLAWQAGYRV